MNICMIGCGYKEDVYSHLSYDLIQKLRSKSSHKVKLITSNCSCFSCSKRFSCKEEELVSTECDYVKIPYVPLNPSNLSRKKYGNTKYFLAKSLKVNLLLETARGISFFRKSKECELIHFDQVLHSFGFISFSTLMHLAKLFNKKVVLTVHELDPIQIRRKKLNTHYNKVDKIITHSKKMEKELIDLGVIKEKIQIIHYGVALASLGGYNRDKFVYWGGHKLLIGKGFDTLLDALEIFKTESKKVKIIIHVGEGCIGLDEGKEMASRRALGDYIAWSEFLSGSELTKLYQESIGCIIPYTGGSGRYPATTAMANATPVIATRKASLPEYLEELGIYITENSPEELAKEMMKLIDDSGKVNSLGIDLRNRAKNLFSWDVIADKILELYEGIDN